MNNQRRHAAKGEAQKWVRMHAHHTGDECLFWPFGGNQYGYGQVWHDGRMSLVHRVMCELTSGPPPSPQHDCAHTCGRGHLGCCNPRHLKWKTKSDNQADRLRHGTMVRGSDAPNAKLTESDVVAIRSANGIAQKDLAAQYGVSRATLSQIINYRKWRWL